MQSSLISVEAVSCDVSCLKTWRLKKGHKDQKLEKTEKPNL